MISPLRKILIEGRAHQPRLQESTEERVGARNRVRLHRGRVRCDSAPAGARPGVA